ncbi:manganese efflux pump MntP [Anaerosacchariphilus polymeriproducens]|uniref:Putative manganese efflux pump MntP n=1 Tax=Anaerosacchariphilus polymeriproducens TaxID=1812858 RepID=A0A371AR36_9FIRM|nr:manganese efflux pump MntP family protein [Anaerosacchariphilus polymeriproducens]RDU22047.1 manganese efflux pump [Anaerosacchariphilus polymeriproducens]
MGLVELFILAVGLSMDAFAVSICKGLSLRKIQIKHIVVVGLYFGIFQGGMPFIGYLLGNQFSEKIVSVDHWIAFILLLIIGINMIKESRKDEIDEIENNAENTGLEVKGMLLLAIATSIDALAVGVTFAFLKVNILPAVTFIGITTFVLSSLGVKIGNVFGSKYKSHAELAGGLILIILGTKILLDHTGFLQKLGTHLF